MNLSIIAKVYAVDDFQTFTERVSLFYLILSRLPKFFILNSAMGFCFVSTKVIISSKPITRNNFKKLLISKNSFLDKPTLSFATDCYHRLKNKRKKKIATRTVKYSKLLITTTLSNISD